MKAIISMITVGAITLASCSNNRQSSAALEAQQNTIDSMKMEMAKKQVIDSMNEVSALQYSLQPEEANNVATTTTTTTRRRSSGTRSSSSNNNNVAQAPVYQAPASYPAQTQAPAEQEKRGWSAKAKGALIGAGTGAAAGAIINKRNRSKGAIIGGAAGAAGGLGVGAIIDKKNGR